MRRSLTDSEIAEIYEKQCRKCMYSSSAGGMKCCDYFLITGMRRNCSPVNCKRFAPRTREKLIKPNFEFPGSLPKLQTKPKVAAVQRERTKRKRYEPYTSAKTHWGQLIDDYMREHNLTQTEFGQKCGTSPGIVNKWRRGQNNPGRKNLECACDFMGIDIEYAKQLIAKGALDADETTDRISEEREKEAEKETCEEHHSAS